MRAIAVAAASGLARPMGLRACVAATKMAVATLPNREFRQAALFLLAFDTRKLCANQRTMNGTFFDVLTELFRRFSGGYFDGLRFRGIRRRSCFADRLVRK